MIVTTPFAGIEDGWILTQAIVDTIPEPLLILDKDLCVVVASRSYYLKFKVDRQDVVGRPVYGLSDGQWNIPDLRLALDAILPRHAVMKAYEVECDVSGIGTRNVLLTAQEVFSEGLTNSLIVLSFDDITERRAIERGLADLLQQKEILLQEMQHRVANSLQIIASILSLKAQTVQFEETRLHLQDAHRRIMSVAAVQQHLQASSPLARITMAPYLSRLCDALATSMIGDTRRIVLKAEVESGTASSTEARNIGLIVTELVINALKHAFVDDRLDGMIIVAYSATEANWRLSVSDNGIGDSKDLRGEVALGLGTNLLEILANQLDGHVAISMTSRGTTVSITHEPCRPLLSAALGHDLVPLACQSSVTR